MGNNQFEALDSEVVGSLTALTYLELQNNKLPALPAGLDINGKAVASGIVKKNRFAMETPAPRMAIVKLSGKNDATFRVISTP